MIDLDTLDDDELAATAYVWRLRSTRGDLTAAAIAHCMEVELQRRLCSTHSLRLPLPPDIEHKPWWQFW